MAAPKDTPPKPGKKAKIKPTSAKAQERLAEALRENLRRRKVQERARDQTAGETVKDKPR